MRVLLLFAILFALSPIPAAPLVLLQEDFNDGVADGFGNDSGDWFVSGGVYQRPNGASPQGVVSSTAGDTSWTDYTLEATFLNAQDGGLFFRGQNDANSYAVIVRPNNNDIYFHIRQAGDWGNQINAVPLNVSGNLQVRVKVEANTFQVFVNDILKTSLTDTTFTSGKVGTYLCCGNNQAWDNVLVTSDAPAIPEPATGVGLLLGMILGAAFFYRN